MYLANVYVNFRLTSVPSARQTDLQLFTCPQHGHSRGDQDSDASWFLAYIPISHCTLIGWWPTN